MSNLSSCCHFIEAIPDGDNRLRKTCPDCGYIAYENPKVVVGAVCTWESQILLCKRAIEPRVDYWTIPAGYLELNESFAEGATREAWEEAQTRIKITGVLGIYGLIVAVIIQGSSEFYSHVYCTLCKMVVLISKP